MSEGGFFISSDAHAEAVERLVRLRDAVAELAEAYEEPVAKRGAEEMRVSLERLLQLLEHRE